jgi:hypothetical protein
LEQGGGLPTSDRLNLGRSEHYRPREPLFLVHGAPSVLAGVSHESPSVAEVVLCVPLAGGTVAARRQPPTTVHARVEPACLVECRVSSYVEGVGRLVDVTNLKLDPFALILGVPDVESRVAIGPELHLNAVVRIARITVEAQRVRQVLDMVSPIVSDDGERHHIVVPRELFLPFLPNPL